MNTPETTPAMPRSFSELLDNAIIRIERVNAASHAELLEKIHDKVVSISGDYELQRNAERTYAAMSSLANQALNKADASMRENSSLALAVATMVEKVTAHCSRTDIHGANNLAIIKELKDDFATHKKWLLSILVTLVGSLAGVVYELISAHFK
jgi:hypothetical protein